MRRWWSKHDPLMQVGIGLGVSALALLALLLVAPGIGMPVAYLWTLGVIFLCAGLSR